VFRLLRLIFVLGGLGAITWFGMTVRLGDRTLFEHVQAIWKTHESQDLLRGTKEKVGNLVDRASEKVVRGVAKSAPGQAKARDESAEAESAKPPLEELPAKDRKALRGIIGHGLEKE
jgi:hypothetical protein